MAEIRKSWTRKQKRLGIIAGIGVILGLATTLVLVALSSEIVFFVTPSQIAEKGVVAGQSIRVGGLVKDGSWSREGDTNHFVVTDGASDVAATFVGIVPDLFREGQGVVAEGALAADGSFVASKVLAKHDEKYIPREIVDELKARGEWRPEGGGP
ncbi:MAG: ccmE [Devosia sp.]|nr:ccmE [Devosia sp.]